MIVKTILHSDANNFFASVEIMLNPELAGKPIAVSGNPDKRHGIILAKSQEAKKYGIQTAETIWQAQKKCKDLILVPPHYDVYEQVSKRIKDIYCQYTDQVESFGIDEAWLDCTESTRLFGDGKTIADTIRERIKKEIGVTVSVGVSFTKIFAKLASDMVKPDATTLITKENYKNTAWKLSVENLLMVGQSTLTTLSNLNIKTIGDLAEFNPIILQKKLGIMASKLIEFANGIEHENVKHYYDKHVPESISNGTTLPIDLTSDSEVIAVITGLSDVIATRIRKYNLCASGIRATIKLNDLSIISKQIAKKCLITSSKEISEIAITIYHMLYHKGMLPIRSITISTYNLEHYNGQNRQMSFIEDVHNDEKVNSLENTIDKLRAKYGFSVVKSGIVEAHKNICSDLIDTDFIPFKKD